MSGYQTSRKVRSGDGLETGRFQLASEAAMAQDVPSAECAMDGNSSSASRFGQEPVGAEDLSD